MQGVILQASNISCGVMQFEGRARMYLIGALGSGNLGLGISVTMGVLALLAIACSIYFKRRRRNSKNHHLLPELPGLPTPPTDPAIGDEDTAE